MDTPEELLEIVDEQGKPVGVAPRSEVHGNPALIHKVVHLLVLNAKGDILLQKRSMNKDVAPGRWDTSVGGHVEYGEDIGAALGRELQEELGLTGSAEFLYTYIHSNPYETELVHTFRLIHEDTADIRFNREEIDEVRFWSLGEIQDAMGREILSDNFQDEIISYLQHTGTKSP